MAVGQAKVLRPVFHGFQVQTMSIVEPRSEWYPVDVTSAPVRWGDPVKEIAGGAIVRATPADTVLLGIAAAVTADNMPVSIARMPLPLDALGRNMVPVYLADALTVFRGTCSAAPAQANVTKTYDLQYSIPDASAPTPVITNGGTAGSTTYAYRISALNHNGETVAGTAASTTTGNATLSATNYNIVTIPAVLNASSFGVYRGTNLIAVVPAAASGSTVYNDVGAAVISAGVAPVNMTGWRVNIGASSTNVVQVRQLDTTPVNPVAASAPLNAVLFTIPAAVSQIGNVSGS